MLLMICSCSVPIKMRQLSLEEHVNSSWKVLKIDTISYGDGYLKIITFKNRDKYER